MRKRDEEEEEEGEGVVCKKGIEVERVTVEREGLWMGLKEKDNEKKEGVRRKGRWLWEPLWRERTGL